jgi:hypothetical protein
VQNKSARVTRSVDFVVVVVGNFNLVFVFVNCQIENFVLLITLHFENFRDILRKVLVKIEPIDVDVEDGGMKKIKLEY